MSILDLPQPCEKLLDFEDCKKVDATDLFGFNLRSKGYLHSGVNVSSAVWTVPAGLTEGASSNDNDAAWVLISGGTVGTSYVVTGTITLSNGEIAVATITIDVIA